jgi:hypothetical protein
MKFAVIALLFVFGCQGSQEDLAAGHPLVGTKAPNVDLPTTTGERATMEQFRGKWLVVHFGTSW